MPGIGDRPGRKVLLTVPYTKALAFLRSKRAIFTASSPRDDPDIGKISPEGLTKA
jgi:hypothetical protein